MVRSLVLGSYCVNEFFCETDERTARTTVCNYVQTSCRSHVSPLVFQYLRQRTLSADEDTTDEPNPLHVFQGFV